MKSLMFGASAAAFTLLMAGSVPAAAQSDVRTPSESKCEWQPQRQYGPRAPLRANVCKRRDQPEEWTGIGGPECDPHYKGKDGHWVWRAPRNYGPRGPTRPPVREWLEAC